MKTVRVALLLAALCLVCVHGEDGDSTIAEEATGETSTATATTVTVTNAPTTIGAASVTTSAVLIATCVTALAIFRQ